MLSSPCTFEPHEKDEDDGELAQFLTQYLEQVESLLNLISTCRSGDWEGYLAALEDTIKYFFARELCSPDASPSC